MQLSRTVWALSSIAALAMTACTQSSKTSTSTSTATESSMAAASTAPAATSQMAAAAGTAAGAKVYSTNCASCHQANGQGVPGTFPPLAGNTDVTGDPKKVIKIVKYGLNGKLQAAGHAYNGMMPAWGTQLSNSDVASVVTYVRTSWGNKGSAVTESDVAAVSK